MVRRSRADTLATNLPQLQNYIKRDPQSYTGEFMQQWRHYESVLELFRLQPDGDNKEFGTLITFISHVCQCYPDVTKPFPDHLVTILEDTYASLHPDLRMSMVNALVLLRNRNVVSTMTMITLFFKLFRCRDKTLRAHLHTYIVADIKNLNSKARNNKVNRVLQNFMYTVLKDTNETAAKKSLEVIIELYRRGIWNDPKTVNVIAEACFSSVPKLVAPALHFFLGTNDGAAVDSDDEDDEDPNSVLESVRHGMQVGGQTKSRQKAAKRALANLKKKGSKIKETTTTFTALQLINDPQGFAERLFSRLRATTSNSAFKFEMRLLILNVLTRVIGAHKLLVMGLYDFMIVYLKPHQREVTSILAYAAQASHNLVPPDMILSMVQAIADNFVWNNVGSEVVTAGLNGLREICSRCPLAMSPTLLQSLLDDYKNFREKGPMMAARGLLALYREVDPSMLRKKDRGRSATMAMKDGKTRTIKFGEEFETTNSAIEVLKSIASGASKLNQDPNGNIIDDNTPLEQVKGWSDFEECSSDEEDEDVESDNSGEDNKIAEDIEEDDTEKSELEVSNEQIEDDESEIDESLESDIEADSDEQVSNTNDEEGEEEIDEEELIEEEDDEEEEEEEEQVTEEQLERQRAADKAERELTDFTKIAQTRILSDNDFKLLRKLQVARETTAQLVRQPVKRKIKTRKVGSAALAKQMAEEEAAESLSAATEYERKLTRKLLKRTSEVDNETGDNDNKKRRKQRSVRSEGENGDEEDGDDSDEGGEDGEEEGMEGMVDVATITRGIRRKNDYEARMESIKAGRSGRTYGSRKGSEERTSITNKEKAKKNKNFMMIAHKRSVRAKTKRSLKDKRRALRTHITKQKRGKH